MTYRDEVLVLLRAAFSAGWNAQAEYSRIGVGMGATHSNHAFDRFVAGVEIPKGPPFDEAVELRKAER